MNTSFQKTSASDEWYTPKEIIYALGEFDLDPCAPIQPLWPTARVMWNKEHDGLAHQWGGREFGAIPHTASPCSLNSVSVWSKTVTGYFLLSQELITDCFKVCSCRTAMVSCFFGVVFGFIAQTVRGVIARAMAAA